MEIAEFLLARIAEDEVVARAAAGDLLADEQDGISRAWFCTYDAMNIWPSHLAHLSRHDPARVLAECAADRRIVEFCRDYLTRGTPEYGTDEGVGETVLRHLAAPYADHPDYQQDWKP